MTGPDLIALIVCATVVLVVAIICMTIFLLDGGYSRGWREARESYSK